MTTEHDAAAVAQHLRKHGKQTFPQVAKATGLPMGAVLNAVNQYGARFVRTRGDRNGPATIDLHPNLK